MRIDYDKMYKDIRRNSSNRIANDIWEKEKKKNYVRPDKRDKEIYDKGLAWFNNGLSLDDAPEDLKNNTNFINGFEKGLRLMNVDDDFFRRGAKAFFDGVDWDSIPEDDKENEFFIQGYEDAMTMNTSRRK